MELQNRVISGCHDGRKTLFSEQRSLLITRCKIIINLLQKALPFYFANDPGKGVPLGLYLPLRDGNKDVKQGEMTMQGFSFIQHVLSTVQSIPIPMLKAGDSVVQNIQSAMTGLTFWKGQITHTHTDEVCECIKVIRD